MAPGGTITLADGLHATTPGVKLNKPMPITADPNTLPTVDGHGECFVFVINGIEAGLVSVKSWHFINAACVVRLAMTQQSAIG